MVAKWAKGLPQNKLEVHQGSPYKNILYVKKIICTGPICINIFICNHKNTYKNKPVVLRQLSSYTT